MTRVTSAADLASAIRDAAAARTPLRFEGGGRWSGPGTPAGRVPAAATAISLAGLTGVVAYVPADFTITVRAGTTLRDLEAITGEHNQWCPLLAWGDDAGTVGATFATATTGPCADVLGRPRDLALGLEFVDGTGAVIRAGGRVVKNVAGFDLTRLVVGSFGALAAVTEITMRLRARPPVDATWCVTPRAGSGAEATAIARDLRHGDIVPLACEVVDERLAAALRLPAGSVLARYGGNRALVEAARGAIARTHDVTEVDPGAWNALRALDPHPRRDGSDALASSVARRIKERFDPARIMNPGVLGEGA